MDQENRGPNWDENGAPPGREFQEKYRQEEVHYRFITDQAGRVVYVQATSRRARMLSDGETGRWEIASGERTRSLADGMVPDEKTPLYITDSGRVVSKLYRCMRCGRTIDPGDTLSVDKKLFHQECGVDLLEDIVWQERLESGSTGLSSSDLTLYRMIVRDIRRTQRARRRAMGEGFFARLGRLLSGRRNHALQPRRRP